MGIDERPRGSRLPLDPDAYYSAAFLLLSQPPTVSASGWMERVGEVSRSTWPVLSHRHIVVKSLPTNPKRSNSHTGIGKRRGFLPITSRYIGRHSSSDRTSLARVRSLPTNEWGLANALE